jgi:uncharacterized protein (DUF1697 family)
MQTYISILRGINVSGHKMIKMDDLSKLYESLGFENIKSYIQSGNVVFQSDILDTTLLANQINDSIQNKYGFEVPVIVLNQSDWKIIAENNPFLERKGIDETKLHVTFLSQKPEVDLFEKLKDGNYKDDEFLVVDKSVYLYCPNGYGLTKLSNTFFENKLKVSATTRNWKTVNELLNIAENINK